MKQEDIDRYLLKSGDDRIYTTNLIENEHGFCSYRVERDILYIINVFGDGRYWDQQLTEIAKLNGVLKMRFSTRRNPAAFNKKFGCKLVGYVMEREVV